MRDTLQREVCSLMGCPNSRNLSSVKLLQTACKSPKLCQWWCRIFAMMKECLHIRNFHLCSGKLLSYEFHNFKRLFQPTLLCLDWGIFCRHCLAAALCWVAGVVKPAPKHDANCPEVGEFSKFSFEIFGKSNDIFLVKLTRRHSRRYFQSQGQKIVIKNSQNLVKSTP